MSKKKKNRLKFPKPQAWHSSTACLRQTEPPNPEAPNPPDLEQLDGLFGGRGGPHPLFFFFITLKPRVE